MTNTETQIGPEEALTMLSIAYPIFKNTGKSRTFMTLGRINLSEEFNVRNIVASHSMDYYKYMDHHFSNPDSDKNAVVLYGIDKVAQYLDALNEVICDTPDLKAAVDKAMSEEPAEPANPSEFEQAIANVAEEVKQEVDTKALEVTIIEQQAATPQQQPPVVAKPTHGLLLDIDSIIRQQVNGYLQAEHQGIVNFAEDMLKKHLLNNTLVVLPQVAKVQGQGHAVVTGRLHMAFKEALEVTIIEQQAFFGGPTGSGKTTLAEQIAEALKLRFAHISCTAGMSEAHLLGRMIADGSYISSEFVDFFENGGVFLADEVDAADPNTTLIINSALANGRLSVPNRKDKPFATRHKDFKFLAAANTWGNGSGDYNGRNILDGAFMDRFALCKLEVQYDTGLEREILKSHPDVAKRLWKLRDAINTQRIRGKHLSTRVFAAAARNFAAGRTEAQLLERYFTGWTEQEIEKVTK